MTHLDAKTKENIIEGCHYCMMMFKSSKDLRKHIKHMHEIDTIYNYVCDVRYDTCYKLILII